MQCPPSKPYERRQFRVLYRVFLSRLIDLEILSTRGQAETLLQQFAAMLAAFSFVYVIVRVPSYGRSGLPPAQLAIAAWGDEHFLIATTMAIAGMFAVLAWNALLPDRIDALALGGLPVRARTMLFAKLAAIGTVLGVTAAAVNAFTGITIPFAVIPPGSETFGFLRSLAAYWVAMAAAAAFVFCAVLALQGLASQLFSYRLYLRVSGFLQLAAFFSILGALFLLPPIANMPGLTDPANQRLVHRLPSLWFLGLFQELNGANHPVFRPLALRALSALALVGATAIATYGLAFGRNIRRIVEQPDIAPSDRSRPTARIGAWLAARLLPKSLDRAIVGFTARTIARSRQHRMLLAVYGGIGLAIALAYARNLVYGRGRWNEPNVGILAGGFVLLFFCAVGMRAVFAVPLALRANWIFRMTSVHSPTAYFAAVRKSMLVLACVPVWIAAAMLYLTVWPVPAAVQHLLIMIATGVLLVQLLLSRFRKVPFTCSYLPGKANLRFKLGANAILFLFLADIGVRIEFWAMERPKRFGILVGIIVALAIWARHRTIEFARSRYHAVQFEELPAEDLYVLDLKRDGALSGDERYVDA